MAKNSWGKLFGWGVVLSGIAGGLSLLWDRDAHASTLPGKVLVKMRKALRVYWRGTKGAVPPAEYQPRPKFSVGDKVKIHNPTALDPYTREPVPPDPLVEGKTATIVELVLYQRVLVVEGSETPIAGEPLRWSYVLDLKVGDVPVENAEDGLVRA